MMTEDIQILPENIIEKLKKQDLFKNVTSEEIKTAITRYEEIHVLTGELTFRKGERYHKGIYFLIGGDIVLSRANSDIKLVCNNCPIGLSTFLGKTMYTMDAIAQSDCDLLFVHEFCIYKLMEISEPFRKQLIKDIQKRLTHLDNSSNTFLMQSIYQTVGGCMRSPVITIQTNKSVIEASRIMTEHKINSLLVMNRKQIVKGIITTQHLTTRFMTDLDNNIKHPEVEKYMDVEPVTFPPEFPIVEALNELQIAGKTHGVVMKDGKPAGIVSIHGISLMLLENSHLYSAHIEHMSSLNELKTVFTHIYRAARTLATSSRVSREVLTAMSAIHRAIYKKAFQLTSLEFKKEKNFNLSDHIYAYLLIGTGARREMDLRPQVNHAFIISDEEPDSAVELFKEFINKLHENLVYIGYHSLSSQDELATLNVAMKYSEWLADIDIWASKEADKQHKFSFSFIMDAVALEGDITLAWSIRNYMLKKVEDKPSIISKLAKLYPPVKIPVSQFGGFIVDKDGKHAGMINLKTQVLSYIVNTTRLLAIYAGINDISTIDRIEHLARKKIITDELAMKAIIAFDTITETLINEQISQSVNNQNVTGYINPTSLSLFYQEKLKRALQFSTIYTSYGVNLLHAI